MIDLLAVTGNLATDLLERTASTPRVPQMVQLSLAPAFLLGGIGAIMNVMMTRMIWIAERIERIQRRIEDEKAGDHELRELPWLEQRRRHAQKAVVFSTASAAVISVVIGLLFISAYIEPQIGTLTAIAWIGFFLLETRLAARGPVASRKWPWP